MPEPFQCKAEAATAHGLERCEFPGGHPGEHSWSSSAQLEALRVATYDRFVELESTIDHLRARVVALEERRPPADLEAELEATREKNLELHNRIAAAMTSLERARSKLQQAQAHVEPSSEPETLKLANRVSEAAACIARARASLEPDLAGG